MEYTAAAAAVAVVGPGIETPGWVRDRGEKRRREFILTLEPKPEPGLDPNGRVSKPQDLALYSILLDLQYLMTG